MRISSILSGAAILGVTWLSCLYPATAQLSTDTVRGSLESRDPRLQDNSPYDEYRFWGEEGERLVLDLQSSDFDTYLAILDGENTVLSRDDDSGNGTDSRIYITLPESGQYRVVLTTYQPSGRGRYNFTIAQTSEPASPPAGSDSRQSNTDSPITTTGHSSIFNPIIRDIRSSLPGGMVMRLPSDEVFRGRGETYASIGHRQAGRLRIDLTSQANCSARACQLGYFETGAIGQGPLRDIDRSNSQYFLGEAPITLADGVVGTYYSLHTRGVSSGAFSVIMWVQDNQHYIISRAGDRQNIIDFARSMANEAPITR